MCNNCKIHFVYIYIYFIVLEGYIKSNFGPIYINNLNKKIGCGSLTDGHFKLEVHIMDFDENEYNFIKGDKIKIIGVMQNTGINYLCIYYY